MNTVSWTHQAVASRLLPLLLTGLLDGCASDPVGGDGLRYAQPVEQVAVCTDEARRAPEQCTGLDSNCDGFVDSDWIVTDCTRKLLSYVSEVAQAQALARKQDGRARFDCTSSGTGLGAVTRNIFSFTGPLPVACNRIIADDCADPDRRNYWVTVIANANDYAATSYQIVWGSSAAQYSRLGVCGPQGTDGDESSVPKLLMPTRDVDQSGQVEACYEHTTGSLSFYLDSPDVRIPIRDIAAIRDLRVRNKDILHADAPTRAKHRFRVDRLIVDVQRPDDTWQTVQLATNLDNDKEPFLQWTQELTCP